LYLSISSPMGCQKWARGSPGSGVFLGDVAIGFLEGKCGEISRVRNWVPSSLKFCQMAAEAISSEGEPWSNSCSAQVWIRRLWILILPVKSGARSFLFLVSGQRQPILLSVEVIRVFSFGFLLLPGI